MILNIMDPIDPKRLILPRSKEMDCGKGLKPPRHKPGEEFLKGPIPCNWLSRAAQLPGKALHTAIAVWFLAGLTRKRTVHLSRNILESFGVNRFAGYRGLKDLEESGLVSVLRHAGRNPTVTILGVKETSEHG
jgi:hypothetical protein